MPSRFLYVGDTSPDIRLRLDDEDGLITTLALAEAIAVSFVGARHTFGGRGIPIDPPVTDAKGNTWNLRYVIQAGDTAHDGAYRILVTVTLALGSPDQVETVATPDRLLIYPLPVSTP